MDKVLLIIKNILRRMLKKRSNFLLHIILPVIASVALFFVFNIGQASKIEIGFADLDKTTSSHWLLEQMSQLDGIHLIEVQADEMNGHVVNRDVSLGIVIPDDFEAILLSGNEPFIEMMSSGQGGFATWIEKAVSLHIGNLVDIARVSGYDEHPYYNMMHKAQSGPIMLESIYVKDEAKAKEAMAETFGTYMIFLLITTSMIAFQIVDEKKKGTFARIGIAPVSKRSYTLANILVNLFIVMIQIGSVLLILNLVLQMEFHANPFIIYLILVVFAICGIGLGVMLASFSKNFTAASVLMSAVLTPSCMIAGCFWPLEFMPNYMQKAAYITPQRWTLDAIDIIQRNNSLMSVLPNLSIVICFTLLFFLIAVYRFKNQDHAIT
ncbi:MAG: ABC transporter permease [Clostridia bacterium]|nr:ABC transporter permease [Clostridia bacterium]